MPKRRRNFTRVVVAGDSQCGHLVGLTPPRWEAAAVDAPVPRYKKFQRIRRECWKTFRSMLKPLQPIDVLLWGGDSIEGCGWRSGGTELIIRDRHAQVDMTTDVIEAIGAPKIDMVYGTPYHTGHAEDLEDVLVKQVRELSFVTKAEVGAHEWPEVNGYIFDMKHKIGRSTIPHGRHTPLMREELWNSLWAEAGMQPKADCLLRFHVHYGIGGYRMLGDRMIWAHICPALQAMGSKFGSRQMSGIVNFGFLHFDISPKGKLLSWQPHVASIQSQKARTTKL